MNYNLNEVPGVKTEMLKALSTGQKNLDQLVMLPKFHQTQSKVLAIALEELVFERMVVIENDHYQLAR